MLPEKLYVIDNETWNKVESQFQSQYGPVYVFVTENKGSLNEAQDIYITAFTYYARALELSGPELLDRAEVTIYSFARRLWLKRLESRRADTSFIRHRREFYELDDAFNDIDLIDKRTDLVSNKLADIGEPCRTLVLEHVGEGHALAETIRRLGFNNEERAFDNITSCIRKLIRHTEKKDLDLSNRELGEVIKQVLDADRETDGSFGAKAEEARVALVLVSRVVAILRSYVARKSRMSRLRELRQTQLPDKTKAFRTISKQDKKKFNMKPQTLALIVGLIAVVVSTLTSFGIAVIKGDENHREPIADEVSESHRDSLEAALENTMTTQAATMSGTHPRTFTAFEVAPMGYFITAYEVGDTNAVLVLRQEQNKVFTVEVVYRDSTLGLAVVKSAEAASSRLPYMPAPKDAEIGSEVFTTGIAEGAFHFSQGVVASTSDGFFSVHLNSTSPGAPVFGDRGQWTGVVVNSNADSQTARVASVESVVKMLRDAQENLHRHDIKLPTRNRLYYDSRPVQVEKVRTHIWNLELSS